MAVTTLTLEDLFSEIGDLARDQGVASKEQWDELVEDIIEDHLDLGELDLDQDTEGMKEVLSSRFGAWKKESALGDDDKKYEEDTVMEEGEERKENDDEDVPDGLVSEEDEI